MVLVLILCVIIIILMLIIIGITASTIKVEINNFEVSNLKKVKAKYKINISTFLLEKIKWISFNIDKAKIDKMIKRMHLEKIDIQKLEKDIELQDIKEIINIRPKISSLKLNMKIGVENVILTSYIIPIICTILAVILPYATKECDRKNINYKIEPVYNNKNIYNIKLHAVLEIKVINILNALYKIYKSKKSNKQSSRPILV